MSGKRKLDTIKYKSAAKRKNDERMPEVLDEKMLRGRLRWQTILIIIGLALVGDLLFTGGTWIVNLAFMFMVGMYYSPPGWAMLFIGIPLLICGMASLSAYFVASYARPTDQYIYQLAITVLVSLSTAIGACYLAFNVGGWWSIS